MAMRINRYSSAWTLRNLVPQSMSHHALGPDLPTIDRSVSQLAAGWLIEIHHQRAASYR